MTTTQAWPARTKLRERNRAALLVAAGELLESAGYAGCSLEAVARRAGVTKGAVYSIFGSKAELFIELMTPRWQAPQFDDVANTPGDLGDLLEAYGRRWALLIAHPDASKGLELAFELGLAALREPSISTVFTQLYERDLINLSRQLESAAAARSAALPLPAEELLPVIIGALQGLSQAAMLLNQPIDEAAFGAAARRLAHL